MTRLGLLGVSLAALARAAQPDAVSPAPAPMRNLTWGQLNFLHTTDTHGWLAGHLQEPQYSADWGDYVSFSEHMRAQATERGADLIMIDTGDRVEGNGLYDSSDPKGLYSTDIFREAPVDIICTGNHELYKAATAKREHEVVAGRDFADRYLASNLDYIDPDSGKRVPQAKQRFRRFKTPNQGIEVLSFGFLFNFEMNDNNTVVQPVEETIKEDWFVEQIKEKPDVIIVIGHVGLRMNEFRTIYAAIRKLDWFTPVLFFGGHAHVRDAMSYDSKSFAMASGRYLETVGWMSVDGIKKRERKDGEDKEDDNDELETTDSSPSFSRRYIDNNLFGYQYHTGLDESTFPTKRGRQVSEMISRARAALDLDRPFGCVPETMWVHRAEYPSKNSVYSWLTDHVVPDMCVKSDRADLPRLTIVNTGGVRFDIFKGPFTRDSAFTVLPFQSKFRYIPDVQYEMAIKVVPILNGMEKILSADGVGHTLPLVGELGLPENRYPIPERKPVEDDSENMLSQPDIEEQIRLDLRSVRSSDDGDNDAADPPLTAGYTTHDDIGDDGDDTVHARVPAFPMPNVVQAEAMFPAGAKPDKVDLVFIDFIQPWIAPALKMAGGDFVDGDVRQYTDDTLTYMITEWISRNWGC